MAEGSRNRAPTFPLLCPSRPWNNMAGICLSSPTACYLVKSSAALPSHSAITWSGRPSCGWETRTITSTLPERSQRRLEHILISLVT